MGVSGVVASSAMSLRQPKYQTIHAALRQQILSGELTAGSQLPPQQEMAEQFGVTLMTLRQAIGALESEGLVWAARGKGTFVADTPVDLPLDNLSSFSAQMRAAGIEMTTEILAIDDVSATDRRDAAAALDTDGTLTRITRRRSADRLAFALQRSYLRRSTIAHDTLGNTSLYDAIEAATGWVVAEARESIAAVALDGDDAAMVDAETGHPAILSIRTSINQYGQPFLYDEALLVGGRCTITADRRSDRLSLSYRAT